MSKFIFTYLQTSIPKATVPHHLNISQPNLMATFRGGGSLPNVNQIANASASNSTIDLQVKTRDWNTHFILMMHAIGNYLICRTCCLQIFFLECLSKYCVFLLLLLLNILGITISPCTFHSSRDKRCHIGEVTTFQVNFSEMNSHGTAVYQSEHAVNGALTFGLG